jgi:18S rRNA (adenine1779-N6/adenine1780-N6)-dimethyltransferase
VTSDVVQTLKALKLGTEEDMGGADDAEMEMEEEGTGPWKEKVLNILREGGYEEKRGSKMTQDDFMQMLSLFNSHGIHFT